MKLLSDALKDVFDDTSRPYAKELFEISDEIALLEGQITTLRERMKGVATAGTTELASDVGAVSAIYWAASWLGMPGAVKDAYRAKAGRVLVVSPLIRTTECADCGGDIQHIISSSSGFNQWVADRSPFSVCGDCTARSQQLSAAQLRQRELRKEHLARMPYKEYLKSPEWAERRARAIRTAKASCQLCNASGVILDVHHRTYKNRGNEKFTDLIVLCRACHSKHHDKGGF
ncbi:HNH endonuclease [Aeromonas rivipollensis]|uniref:HNH endonuclease n=1 Tax=Aeromonas rivipollensis TaxID=948519 RepID=UPI003D2273E7